MKQSVIDYVASLPDDCTLEDILYHLYVRSKVERGLKAIEDGDVVSQEEAERRIERWIQEVDRDG